MDGMTIVTNSGAEPDGFGYWPSRRLPKAISKGGFHDERVFGIQLRLERKRAERSRKGFCLILINVGDIPQRDRWATLKKIVHILATETRETDIKGWYEYGVRIGVIFTELGGDGQELMSASEQMLEKIYAGMGRKLQAHVLQAIEATWHVFPEHFDINDTGNFQNRILYSDLSEINKKRSIGRFVKRTIDVAGSLGGLIFLAPVFLGIAILVKSTSKGPVFFRQERVGLFGKKFTFLKFRSMHVNNDSTIHREFVSAFIANSNNGNGRKTGGKEGEGAVFKMTNDPRVTPIGRFMRKTSLDELPQLINVLRGDMSLVGPRPPIPYEYERYDIWHRRRLSLMRPGITGLWQVCGRSRVTFDDMVRLDIQYTAEWSLGLDCKILVKTPLVVLMCEGAY